MNVLQIFFFLNTHPDGSFEEWAYDALGLVISHRARNGGVTTTTRDARGMATATTDPLGNVTTYTYDAFDRVASVTDPRGFTTAFSYDWAGRVTAVTHPDASTRTAAYDLWGNRVSLTDELGHSWTWTYDEFRRQLTATDPLGRTTSTSYAAGPSGCGSCHSGTHPTAITSPGGSVTAFTYDPAWRRTSMTLASGTSHAATTTYSYDTAGNLAATTDPAGRTTTYAYDISGNKVQEIAPLGLTTSWAYDAFGNTLAITAPDGRTTSSTYDAANRPLTVTDPNNATTTHTYHPGGAPASLTDARGNTYSFTYDLLGRKTAMLYPDGSSEQWAYNDSAGLTTPRWTYTARDGSTMSCTADARGRDTFCDFSDPLTPDVTSSYDAAGRLVSASSSVSTSLYGYDAANQLLSETTSYSGLAGSRIVGYAYDMDGRRSQLFYPDGTVVDYTHTPRGQLAAITADGPPPLAAFTYDPSGLPLTRTLENNTSTAYDYDGAGRLLSVAHSGNGTALRTIAYTLDPNGRRTSREDNGALEIYGYDPTGQLTSVSASTNATYSYDPVGNRQNVTGAVPGSGTYFADTLNRYTAAPGGGAAYDQRGNLVAHAGRTLGYDSRNRLVNATVGGNTITTTYDHRNRAVKRTVDGTATYFVWDDWSLIAELDASGTVLQRYIQGPGIDNLIAKINATGTVYYHQDGLGSTVALTDATGSNVETYTYDAFGAVRILDPSPPGPRHSSAIASSSLAANTCCWEAAG